MNIHELGVKSEEAARMLKALANPHRLRILCELQDGERSVTRLETAVGLTQSALSQHLARLREQGIVATRREAQTIYYRVADERAARLLAVLYDVFCAPDADKKASGGAGGCGTQTAAKVAKARREDGTSARRNAAKRR